mmetsp:Transcript_19648/g.39281  ORF Transcript_19648/g.39281 Transcript_19648/m.39281 type:complete len:204 (-) Transcript_19648:119-730(-)
MSRRDSMLLLLDIFSTSLSWLFLLRRLELFRIICSDLEILEADLLFLDFSDFSLAAGVEGFEAAGPWPLFLCKYSGFSFSQTTRGSKTLPLGGPMSLKMRGMALETLLVRLYFLMTESYSFLKPELYMTDFLSIQNLSYVRIRWESSSRARSSAEESPASSSEPSDEFSALGGCGVGVEAVERIGVDMLVIRDVFWFGVNELM